MEWRPKTWIAIVLAIVVQPLAMLYLMRVGWALVYFLAGFAVALTEYYVESTAHAAWLRYFSFNYLIIVICVIHAYRLTRNSVAVSSRPWYSRWYGLTGILLLPYAALLVGRTFFLEPFTMPSGSMLPTLPVGSHIVVDKWGYGNYRLFGIHILKTRMTKTIKRGDMIVFDYPENPRIQYVKRVVGLPGDRVEYRDKELIINGVEARYREVEKNARFSVLREDIDGSRHLIEVRNQHYPVDEAYNVPAKKYFVLGDSRDNSSDSRYWGYVPQGNIIGKVIYVVK